MTIKYHRETYDWDVRRVGMSCTPYITHMRITDGSLFPDDGSFPTHSLGVEASTYNDEVITMDFSQNQEAKDHLYNMSAAILFFSNQARAKKETGA